jgi:hypothetical protein
MERIQEISSTVEINSIEFENFILITNASLDFSLPFFADLDRSSLTQTRVRSSRKHKVNMRWLPVELVIEIFRRVQKLIGRWDFKLNCRESMKLERQCYNNLLAFALSSKEWTAIAQAELFRNIILKNRSETGQFFKLVRDKKELRSHAESAVSIRFGGAQQGHFDMKGLDDDLDEITLYCPNVVVISCYEVRVVLEYFRT